MIVLHTVYICRLKRINIKNPLVKYKELFEKHSVDLLTITRKNKGISYTRLSLMIAALVLLYFYIKTSADVFIILSIMALIVFLVFIKIHDHTKFLKSLTKQLVDINLEEIRYLEHGDKPFYAGSRYQGTEHNYTHDLDIFGDESLYHHTNRCYTYIGQTCLADNLIDPLASNKEIIARQEAIKELSTNIGWRQKFAGLARIHKDEKSFYDFVVKWSKSNSIKLSPLINVLSYVMPIIFFIFLGYVIFASAQHLVSFVGLLLIFNLGILGSQFKKIKDSLQGSDKLSQILRQYALLIAHIEDEPFDSPLLQKLQQQLTKNDINAQTQFRQLSKLFSEMDSMDNLMASLFFNGSCLYHLHKFRALNQWKESYADHILNWLGVMGGFELLNSLANFGFNNPDFIYPTLNDQYQLSFKNLGHPLLGVKSRVDNTVSFNDQKFIILTGSNMSGKSTFLRSLGVNMVLTQMGAPICATDAQVHPLKILVSMRAEDSLSENESYFFAEVKRLKFLIDQSKQERCFILLDEILRGTNSNDKRSGTIRYIKRLLEQNTIGAIATHDLEVCRTTDEYPDYLANKCFEVEIVNDQLHFDYKLKAGICQNQSATFLMNQMGII